VPDWTVRVDSRIDTAQWATGKPLETLVGLRDWLARCQAHGPPFDDVWLVELEDGYRYRYWLIDINVTVEFLALAHERWILIKAID
jgi:hypothetical protein